jgi:hypothetical protein
VNGDSNYDFGSIEGLKAIADYHDIKIDEAKFAKKNRNAYLRLYVSLYGDKFPLEDIIKKALSFTFFDFDAGKSEDLKAVLLCLLGVMDTKRKICQILMMVILDGIALLLMRNPFL